MWPSLAFASSLACDGSGIHARIHIRTHACITHTGLVRTPGWPRCSRWAGWSSRGRSRWGCSCLPAAQGAGASAATVCYCRSLQESRPGGQGWQLRPAPAWGVPREAAGAHAAARYTPPGGGGGVRGREGGSPLPARALGVTPRRHLRQRPLGRRQVMCTQRRGRCWSQHCCC